MHGGRSRRLRSHGTSHRFIWRATDKFTGGQTHRLVSCHLGSGASLAAIKDGKDMVRLSLTHTEEDIRRLREMVAALDAAARDGAPLKQLAEMMRDFHEPVPLRAEGRTKNYE